jgi:hypothetical protein
MVGMCDRGGLFTSWQPGSKDRDRKGSGFHYPLWGHFLNYLTSFHWPPPLLKVLEHLAIMPQAGEQASDTLVFGGYLPKPYYLAITHGGVVVDRVLELWSVNSTKWTWNHRITVGGPWNFKVRHLETPPERICFTTSSQIDVQKKMHSACTQNCDWPLRISELWDWDGNNFIFHLIYFWILCKKCNTVLW